MKLEVKESYIGYSDYIKNMTNRFVEDHRYENLSEEDLTNLKTELNTHGFEEVSISLQDEIIRNKRVMNLNMHKGRDENLTPDDMVKLDEEWASCLINETKLFNKLAYLEVLYIDSEEYKSKVKEEDIANKRKIEETIISLRNSITEDLKTMNSSSLLKDVYKTIIESKQNKIKELEEQIKDM